MADITREIKTCVSQ